MSRLSEAEIVKWWRQIGEVAPGLLLCGDLPEDEDDAVDLLVEWISAGVTDILDVREEWSDEAFVVDMDPEMHYWHLGTHDDGGVQGAAWFDAGVEIARRVAVDEDAVFLVHCHMGINRGPSMAFAILLDQGFDLVAALDAIRTARPIAAISYAKDAVRWHHDRLGSVAETVAADLAAVERWHRSNKIEVDRVIRQIRRAERRQAA